jgi:NAD(P)-dependent dehydrogenase (short-subunit alcohol dehydrogenase family)
MEGGMQGRTVLVTGGSSGIGRAIASAFADAGARLAVTYHEHREAGEAVAARAEEGLAVRLALEDRASIRAAVRATIERFGAIDVLVVNAVRWPQVHAARFEELPPEEWRAQIRANLEGAFETVRAALPPMRERGWGRIVFLSSGIAEEGVPTAWGYAAAKAGLHGFARALAWDAGADGILVNVILTGFTATERNRAHFPDELRARVAAAVPQRRLSDAEDVARLVLFLGSPANTSVTGEVVREGTSTARSISAFAA